jgi:hypothetical protein
MSNNYSDQYCEIIRKYLHGFADAQSWLLLYGIYCHSIDDIIDGDQTSDEHKLATFETALMLYSHVFYQQNIAQLYTLCKLAHTSYVDSVRLEKSENPTDQLIADPLRQVGNEIILAVIEMCAGKDARNAASKELRPLAWKTHHTPEGLPC